MKPVGKPVHLTDDEVRSIQKAFADRRRPGSYQPGKWATSHLNRDPRVIGVAWPDHYPKKVVLRDITLRTIEQTPGVTLSPAQRKRLAEALVDVGVSAVEIRLHGWGTSTDELKDEVSYLKHLRPDIEIKMGGTTTDEMVDLAADLGVTIAEMWFPALPAATAIYWTELYRVTWNGGDWRKLAPPLTLDQQIERAKSFADLVRKRKLRPSAGINLLTMVDEEHLEKFCKGMDEAGMEDIWLSDGPAGLSPEALGYIVGQVKKFAPKVRIGIYARNTFGLAVANVLACVHAGAGIVDVAVNGLHAATGQADLAIVAAALEMLYGVDTGIDLSKLTSLARLASDVSGVPLDPNHPITGSQAFNWGGAEILSQELKVEPLLHWVIEPSVVGGEKKWEISPQSGEWTVLDKLKELDIDVDRALIPLIRERLINELHLRRRSLTDAEIAEVAMKVKAEAPAPVRKGG
jgi:isopropylmalate/homocitrate/citramalate synthase